VMIATCPATGSSCGYSLTVKLLVIFKKGADLRLNS